MPAVARAARVRPTGWLPVAALLIVVSAAVLSFVNLGGKVYWHDEAYTSLRVFGHTGPEYYDAMFDDRLHSVDELRAYQHASPDRDLHDTFRALASRPEHTPLYFVLARLWSGLFTDPVVALRSLSALCALLMLPAVYWFALELFGNTTVARVALVLVAVSPLHLLYAQEAREYALWSLLIMLSGAALLRALRSGGRGGFTLYAATLVLGLYAHIMFACTLACHAVYVVSVRNSLANGVLRYFAAALLAAVLLFVPWLWLLLQSLPDVAAVTDWMHRSLELTRLSRSWLVSINRLFFDFPGSDRLAVFSSLLAAMALFALPLRTPVRAWLLPLLLVVVPAAVVIVPDLFDGGRRSLETRYLMPALLALQLCVGWLAGSELQQPVRRAGLAAVLMLLLIAGGIASQLVIITAPAWWNKSFSAEDGAVAEIVNAAQRPLLIGNLGEVAPGELLTLSYFLQDRVQLLLLKGWSWPDLPEGYDRYYVLSKPWSEVQARAHGYVLSRVPEVNKLWELRRVDASPAA